MPASFLKKCITLLLLMGEPILIQIHSRAQKPYSFQGLSQAASFAMVSWGLDCQTQYIDEHDGNCATPVSQLLLKYLSMSTCNLFWPADQRHTNAFCVNYFVQMSSWIHWSSLSATGSLSSIPMSEWSSLQEPSSQWYPTIHLCVPERFQRYSY